MSKIRVRRRIWYLSRQKKQVEGKEAQPTSKRHLEPERAWTESIADFSEDLSAGEKVDVPAEIQTHSLHGLHIDAYNRQQPQLQRLMTRHDVGREEFLNEV